jgi:hypothetical protein
MVGLGRHRSSCDLKMGHKSHFGRYENRTKSSLFSCPSGFRNEASLTAAKVRSRRLSMTRIPQVNDLFDVTLRETPAGVHLLWEMKKDKEAWRDLREGAYMMRTNLQADSAEQMWSMYMQLTEAEASFRVLESELSIQPLFHQKEPRVKAHVGGLSRLCLMGDAQASAAASASYRPTILGRRCGMLSLSPQ